MNKYYYYHLIYQDGIELEVIVEETSWEITIHSPHFTDTVYHVLHRRDEVANKWEKVDWEFIVINDECISKKILLGYKHFSEFPPGYYEL